MRTKFDDAIAFVFEAEGGYTMDPKDPGGETMFGISRVHAPAWKGWAVVDAKKKEPDFPASVNADADLKDQAKEIYRLNFWEPLRCEELPYGLALGLFDMGVNQGVGTAIKIFQRTLGVKDDGVFGPKTMAAALAAPDRMQTLLLARRLVAYHDLMKAKPNLEIYAMNWFHRVVTLARHL